MRCEQKPKTLSSLDVRFLCGNPLRALPLCSCSAHALLLCLMVCIGHPDLLEISEAENISVTC